MISHCVSKSMPKHHVMTSAGEPPCRVFVLFIFMTWQAVLRNVLRAFLANDKMQLSLAWHTCVLSIKRGVKPNLTA